MQSVYKYKRNIRLIKQIVKTNWHYETAYFTSNIFVAISPFVYTISFLLFISVLFQNINSIAGYSRDEMLFLFFIGQLSFYSFSFWAEGGISVEKYVNNGTMDYILTRPVSSLFFITVHKIMPLQLIINYLGPLTPSWLIINWSNLNLAWGNFIFAVIIFLCGVVLYHQAQFLSVCISFWTGRAKQASLVVFAVSSQNIPLEGLGPVMRILVLGIYPVMISSVVASVMLGKSNAVLFTSIVVVVFIIFSILKRRVWAKALKQYSSASS